MILFNNKKQQHRKISLEKMNILKQIQQNNQIKTNLKNKDVEKNEKPTNEISEKPKDEIIDKPKDEIIAKPTNEITEKPTSEITEKPKEEIIEESNSLITIPFDKKTNSNYVNNDTSYYINHTNADGHDIFTNLQSYEKKMFNINLMINDLLNKSEQQDPYMYRKLIMDDPNKKNKQSAENENVVVSADDASADDVLTDDVLTDDVDNKEVLNINSSVGNKKNLLNMKKIKKTVENSNTIENITSDTVYDKFTSIVNKINNKIQTEISKDLFTYSDILTNKKAKDNIFNIICLTILEKIEKIVS
jgi:hypothetical protein